MTGQWCGRLATIRRTGWLGFPTSETVYQGIGLSPQAQSTFYYDGTTSCTTASTNQTPTKGHLTRTVRWLNGGRTLKPGWPMMLTAICMHSRCERQPSTVAHDATNTFPTTATNALSQVTTTQYYGIAARPDEWGFRAGQECHGREQPDDGL